MEKKQKIVVIGIIGGGIAVVGSGIAIQYWLQRRKMIEEETLKDLQETQPRNISQDRFIRPQYGLLRKEMIEQEIPHGVPPRGGFKQVSQEIVPRGGFNSSYEYPNYAQLRLRERRQRTVPLTVLEKYEYENAIEAHELKKQKRKRRVARFNVSRKSFQ